MNRVKCIVYNDILMLVSLFAVEAESGHMAGFALLKSNAVK